MPRTLADTHEYILDGIDQDSSLAKDGGGLSAGDRQLLLQLRSLLTSSPSIHGRRTRGAKESQLNNDYVLRRELTNNSLLAASLVGTRAQRLLLNKFNYAQGTQFLETDTKISYTLVYLIPGIKLSAVWVYRSGMQTCTLNPNTKPTPSANDIGFLIYATDFDRVLRWDGSVWLAVDYDSLKVSFFVSAPSGPWGLCDGTTYNYHSPAGVTANFASPNLIGQFIKAGSAYTGAIVAAVAPSLSGTLGVSGSVTGSFSGGGSGSTNPAYTGITYTDFDGTHYHDLNCANAYINCWAAQTNSDDCVTVEGTIFSTPVSVSGCNSDIDLIEGGVSGQTETTSSDHDHHITDSGHDHSITISVTGSISGSFSGSTADASGLTIGTNGAPSHIVLLPYMRK